MASVAVVGNNCYADLHIYGNSGEAEHVYSSLQRKEAPIKPISFTWRAIYPDLKFRSSKFALLAGLSVLIVLVVSSAGTGYFIGKRSCEKQVKKHFKSHKESGLQETTTSTIITSAYTSSTVPGNNTTMINTQTTRVLSTRIRNNTRTREEGGIANTTDDKPRITPNLNGRTYKLYRQTDDRFWHYDESVRKYVSGIWQPDDIFIKFKFLKMADGSYKIMSIYRKVFLYDGFGVPGAKSKILNGRENPDDDHMRFLVTMETKTLCRIRTKATGRYLRMDENLLVSSKRNIKDDNSLFRLERVG